MSSQFAARVQGATAGVTSQRGHAVFASSVAKKSGAHAASPSTRSAAGDVWSGIGSGNASPSVSAASAFSSGPGGGSGGIGAGMAILGIGVIGVFGTFLVAAARRRRAASHSK